MEQPPPPPPPPPPLSTTPLRPPLSFSPFLVLDGGAPEDHGNGGSNINNINNDIPPPPPPPPPPPEQQDTNNGMMLPPPPPPPPPPQPFPEQQDTNNGMMLPPPPPPPQPFPEQQDTNNGMMLPPPPPPPPSTLLEVEGGGGPEQVEQQKLALSQACRELEHGRCQYAELEALLYLGSYMLSLSYSAPPSTTKDQLDASSGDSTTTIATKQVPLPVQEVVEEVLQTSALQQRQQHKQQEDETDSVIMTAAAALSSGPTSHYGAAEVASNTKKQQQQSQLHSFPPPGQWGHMAFTSLLAHSLQRAAQLASDITGGQSSHEQSPQQQEQQPPLFSNLVRHAKMARQLPTADDWLHYMDERIHEIKSYHARYDYDHDEHDDEKERIMMTTNMALATTAPRSLAANNKSNNNKQARRLASQGFDLASIARPWWSLSSLENQQFASPNEVLGKYLDLEQPTWMEIIQQLLRTAAAVTATEKERDAAKNKSESEPIQNKPSTTSTTTTTTTTIPSPPLLYTDFLQHLLQAPGLDGLVSESVKLRHRKVYGRFLHQLEDYLMNFLQRTQPLLNVARDLVEPTKRTFAQEWKQTGGYAAGGWQCRPAEAQWIITPEEVMAPENMMMMSTTITTSQDKAMATKQSLVMVGGTMDSQVKKDKDKGGNDNGTSAASGIDLSKYETADSLAQAVDGDLLKVELGRLGLKCGGTVLDRAKRLFVTKQYKHRSEWPRKILAKTQQTTQQTPQSLQIQQQQQAQSVSSSQQPASNAIATTKTMTTGGAPMVTDTAATGTAMKHERRVDLAQREAIVIALLHQVKPTLVATLRRVERRQGQTAKERETELEEDLFHGQQQQQLHGSSLLATDMGKKRKRNGEAGEEEEDDDDDDEAPIYNPKNVPLDWDGKPIPYWLFKLHGLNHYYECEICGGVYRGRRNFELHFADSKHAMGMKALGIPNTQHFHGITKIDDAKALWKTLQAQLTQTQFDASTQEEYEDSHGNVLSRTTYEDLARQGLL